MTPEITRPRILVVADEDVVDGVWGNYAADYASAVEAAGGEPIPLYYGRYMVDAVPAHDGLVTIGGSDVDPARYGETRDARVDKPVPARDAAELALTRLALDE